MGSKNRIVKEILPIMLKERGQRTWVEPFVGGANIIDKVNGNRIGNDNQEYVISLYKALQSGWKPPIEVGSDTFWEVCRNWSKQGHIVFVSEYTAPDDFECVWSKEISASANNSIKNGQCLKAVEKLFKFSPTNVD